MTKEKKEDYEKSLFGGLQGKQRPWLRAYLDESNKKTFLNKTESTRAAGYNCSKEESFSQIGCENYRKLNERIAYWLDKHGLSDNSLETKLVSLMNVKETKIINIKGKAKNLPENCILITETNQEKFTDTGKKYIEYHSVIGVNMEANNIQTKSLELALRVKGKFTEKIEITNLSDLGKRLNEAHKRS